MHPLSGRYLNGTVELKVRLDTGGADTNDSKKDKGDSKKGKADLKKGGLVASVVSATANGKPLPSEIHSILKERNLFENLPDEAILEFTRAAKAVEIQDGKLIIQR